MKLGLSIGYSGAHLDIPVKLVQRAEELGYEFGVDRGGLRLRCRDAARVPGREDQTHQARHRHHAARRAHAGQRGDVGGTVDAMAGGGRFIAGIGVSGPQIVEGWYGQPWGRPYYRMKDYVAIMRKIFAREAPVTHEGKEISLPYKGDGSMGLGKPLKSILHMNPRSRSISPPGTRRRSSSPRRSPTAGCRWASCPAQWMSTGRGWRRASAAPATARASRLHHPGLGACRGR